MDFSYPAAVKIGWVRGLQQTLPFRISHQIVFVVNDLTWFEQKYVAMLHQKYVQCKQHKEGRGETGHKKVISPRVQEWVKHGETETWTDHKTIGHHNQNRTSQDIT